MHAVRTLQVGLEELLLTKATWMVSRVDNATTDKKKATLLVDEHII